MIIRYLDPQGIGLATGHSRHERLPKVATHSGHPRPTSWNWVFNGAAQGLFIIRRFAQKCKHVQAHRYINLKYMNIHMYTYVYIHTYIHTYMQTHTHTLISISLSVCLSTVSIHPLSMNIGCLERDWEASMGLGWGSEPYTRNSNPINPIKPNRKP